MDINKVNNRLTALTNAIATKLIDLELKNRVLEELLADRGITFEEIGAKTKIIQDRDFDDLKLEMLDLLRNYERDAR